MSWKLSRQGGQNSRGARIFISKFHHSSQIQRACAVEMHIDDVERHECAVNSNELAAHARTEQRSKHPCLSPTVRTPSVTTLFGEKLSFTLCRCLLPMSRSRLSLQYPRGSQPATTSPAYCKHFPHSYKRIPPRLQTY